MLYYIHKLHTNHTHTIKKFVMLNTHARLSNNQKLFKCVYNLKLYLLSIDQSIDRDREREINTIICNMTFGELSFQIITIFELL